MAYLTPQQYLDALTSGMGGRVTAYEDPSQKDPNEILQVTGDWLNRTGAPNLSARASTYRGGSGGGPTNLQRGMDGFGFEPAPQMWDSPPPGAAGRSPATTPPSGVGVPYGQPVLSGLQQLEKAGIARRPQATEADGPEGLMSKIGGFLRRPGISEAIGSFGGQMARTASQPGASFWTSLATGGDAARESLARSREEERLEADRAREEEDRAIQRAAQERVREVIDQLGPDATEEERASALLRAATEAAAGGNTNLSNAIRLIAEDYAPPEIGAAWTGWAYMGGTGYAVEGPDGEWIPATGGQQGVPGRWRSRTNKFTGEEEREFVPIGAAPEDATEVGGRDSDIGQQTAAAAIAGLSRLRPFVMDMAGLNRTTGEPVEGIDNIVGLLASTMDQNIGQTDAGWFKRALRAQARRMFNESDIPMVENILSGQLAALQVVNPMVRWLSGAQMTNQETSRYYKALIPSWGDTLEQTRIKMLGMETLALAMSGEGDYLEAIQRLGGLGQEIAPRQTGEDGVSWLEPEEDWQRRLQSYAEGQAAQIYNNMEVYAAQQEARTRAAGPQW